MKRQSEGADSSPKRLNLDMPALEEILRNTLVVAASNEPACRDECYHTLTRQVIAYRNMNLWNIISANKDVYWPNDEVVRGHLKYAIENQSSQIAIDLINKKVPLHHYVTNVDGEDSVYSYVSLIITELSREEHMEAMVALLNNGYDINERYEDFYKTALSYALYAGNPEVESVLLIANGAKFKHSYEVIVNGQAHIRETVRLIFEEIDHDNHYDEREVRRVGIVLSATIMGHYGNLEQCAEVNSAIGLAVGQYFDRDGGEDEPAQYMLENLDSNSCMTRNILLQQIRREIVSNCNGVLDICLHDRLNHTSKRNHLIALFNLELGADFPLLEALSHAAHPEWSWKSTVFYTFGWNTVAEAKTALAQNPEAAQQIAERCINRLEEQHKAQQMEL